MKTQVIALRIPQEAYVKPNQIQHGRKALIVIFLSAQKVVVYYQMNALLLPKQDARQKLQNLQMSIQHFYQILTQS